MCYFNQIKQCKTSTMLYLNYVKQNTTSILCFSMHVKQNKNNAILLLNHRTHKTVTPFCFIECKHKALSAMCYLNQVMYCKICAMLYLNYVK